ncbi:serine hydrolase [Panacibacter ginsenosidivorans]|uniref:Serine hydrolase n=1 Tax=Panacibacter ginsenosidivorans TaxID=1813871 RepID=A0A5B8V767_9BACT|nr:serine hydrolase [Panacibacter ginsenosidivorans]QEC67089.1 serine hydrolase [Panacibacter ginsenosidivorans]
MRKITALFFLIVITTTAFAQKQKSTDDKRFAGLDTAFARVLKDWKAAGFAVAVVEKDKVVYAKGFGYRDVENKIPATANTLFAIGSCTKAFTASLIGMLSKDDKVDIDKPVRAYLPELKFYNDEMNDHITLRDMMCHRTGLPRHDYSWYYFSTQSRDSIMQRIAYMEPSAGLREKWQYNNFMFFLQGVVTEKLTGQSWEDNIKEKIFKPLGMDSATVSIDEMQKHGDIAVGYGLKNDSIIKKLDYYHIDAMAPAGSINSSVNDMAKWVTTWINGGKYNGKELLPASYINQAMSSQMVISGALPSKEKPDLYMANYGFGWMLSSYKGHYRVEHGGNIDGFSASTSFFPSDSIGIIVLCNQDGSSVPSIVRNLIADRMLGLKYFDWETDLRSAVVKAKAAAKDAEKAKTTTAKKETKPTHELKDYEGLYSNKGYGTFEVVLKNDSLFALPGKHTWWLKHLQYDIFMPVEKDKEGNLDTSENSDPLQFNMNVSGDIESVDINFEPSLKPIAFSKTPKGKEITKEELQQYEGEYDLSGTAIKVYLKGEKTLYLFVPGQPEYELVPVDKDKFSIKILKGFTVQFNRDDKKEVNELLSIQPNGTFKATKKKK